MLKLSELAANSSLKQGPNYGMERKPFPTGTTICKSGQMPSKSRKNIFTFARYESVT